MYIYTYIHICMCIGIYVCTYIYTHTNTYLSKYIYIRTHIYICACIYLHVGILKYKFEHVPKNQLIHEHIHKNHPKYPELHFPSRWLHDLKISWLTPQNTHCALRVFFWRESRKQMIRTFHYSLPATLVPRIKTFSLSKFGPASGATHLLPFSLLIYPTGQVWKNAFMKLCSQCVWLCHVPLAHPTEYLCNSLVILVSMRVLRHQFLWRVISSTVFHSSPSAPTSCCFCISYACAHFSSLMLLASAHLPDFMAHDVSASQNLDGELLGGIVWELKNRVKSCIQLLKKFLQHRWHLHKEYCRGIFRHSKARKSFTIDIVPNSAFNTHLTAEPILK